MRSNNLGRLIKTFYQKWHYKVIMKFGDNLYVMGLVTKESSRPKNGYKLMRDEWKENMKNLEKSIKYIQKHWDNSLTRKSR